jgi:WD40 repeat protein/tRNA A-37 threonylcarbamoyl transferase component Bud32
MSDSLRPSGDLPPQQGRQIDRLCDRFERGWKAGRRPQLERYLGQVPPPLRPELLHELLALELAYRRRRGEQPGLAEYQQRFPEYAEQIAAAWSETTRPRTAPNGLLPRLAVSSLVRQAATRTLADSTPASGLLALWTELLRPPEREPSSSEVPPETRLLETVGGVGQPTATGPDRPGSVALAQSVLGDYEILNRLGKGGMGEVYRARHRHSDRIVALKIIRPDRLEELPPAQRQEWLDRFRKEAQAAARSEHPHVVTVYDVNEIDGRLFYSMRYVDGRSLADLLDERPLDNQRAAAYLETVARAVHHVHGCGVLHRDLKPKNILIDRQDQPLVADFGLAKWRDEVLERTHTLGPVGTPSYMSPEQVDRPGSVGIATDIYSLGATLYALLTNRPPFQAADPLVTLRQVVDDEPVPPRQLNPAIDRDLEQICLKCLRKEPNRRYESALQLADELRRYRAGEPLRHTRPVRRPERMWRWCRRHPGPTAIIGLVAAVLFLCVGLLFTWEWARSANAIREKEHQAQRLSKELMLQQGLTLLEGGDPGRAMHWLARGLTIAPEENPDLEHALRMNLGSCRQHLTTLREILPHEGAVTAVAFRPDGKAFVTASGTHAQLWDTATSKAIGPVREHTYPIRVVAFSPDGKRILTGSGPLTEKNGEARLWDAATGKLIAPPLVHSGPVLAVAFSPDGKTFVTGTAHPKAKLGVARIWETATGAERRWFLFDEGAIYSAAFSPDGQRIATGGEDGSTLIWEPSTGRTLVAVPKQDGAVHAVAFTADGRILATGCTDGVTQLWEATSGKHLDFSLPRQHAIRSVAFSPDGRSLLTDSGNRNAFLWDIENGQAHGSTLVHQDEVLTVALSPDGKHALTGGKDATARLWDLPPDPVPPPLAHRAAVRSVALSADSKLAITGSWDGTARIWNAATGRPVTLLPLKHQKEVSAVAFSPDGKTALTGSWDKTASVLDVATGMRLHSLQGHGDFVWAVAYSPDGKSLATASADHTVRLWDAVSGKELHQLRGPQDLVGSVAFSPDSKTLVASSWDHTAWLWDVATGAPLHRFLGHQEAVRVAAFSPDGRVILTGSEDKTARLWEAATGNPIGQPMEQEGPIWSVAFSPDGQLVLTGSADSTARLWYATSGLPTGRALQHRGTVAAVAFSPDGKIALTGSWDMTARLWDVATGAPLGPVLQHRGTVSAVAFSHDGKTILTGSGDQTGRLWPVPAAVDGSATRIRLWAEVLTGMELDDDKVLHELHTTTWRDRRQRLQELSDSPAQ